MYDEDTVQSRLWQLHITGKSLRRIAKEEYDDQLTYGDIQRALEGKFPNNPEKRHIFNIYTLVLAPVCRTCGEIEVTMRCRKRRKKSINWHYHFGMTDDLLEKRLNWPN